MRPRLADADVVLQDLTPRLHYGVEVDGKVVDNNTPGGMPRGDWQKDLDHRFGLTFKEIDFGLKEGYKKAKGAINSVGAVVVAGAAVMSDEAKAAADDPVQAVFDWSPLSDVWEAVKIKSTGGCDGSGRCSDMIYPTTKE